MRGARPILFVKPIAKVIWAILVLALVSGCGESQSPTPQRVLNVGMILGSGGLGDRSFNDSAYAGLQEAQRHLSKSRFAGRAGPRA